MVTKVLPVQALGPEPPAQEKNNKERLVVGWCTVSTREAKTGRDLELTGQSW